MFILSSCKIRRDLRERLVEAYPALTFQFTESMEEAASYLPEADVLLTYGEDLTDERIEEASKLKWIMVLSAGLDKMPFKKIEEKGILVTNSKGIHKVPMAEYAIAMLLQTARKTRLLLENEKAHEWDRGVKPVEITGKTMLVVGTGAIGQEVARLAQAFRMYTIGVSNSGAAKQYFDNVYTKDDFEAQLPEADFVISVLPSTPETKDFFKRKHFEMMKPEAVFLNMGRGDAVNNDVLLDVMEERIIYHAILDVFETEPLPGAHPFWEMGNVTVTPHSSGMSPHYQPRAMSIFEENLHTFRSGGEDLINLIDPRKGY
ncbi:MULTISPECIES: D-2-hydroxyacid dehydrogenase [Pontibacillus]|uniref:D-2-hydroxyacid dehydrogenase n=1 Tax=Pontibacillus chungwhensis TaxID=265426 RepID=A0ABY8UZK1_9BACI|nr:MULTISPECIES: D-2-hydroxyacid dehydrogenase [Pontibacillus]MCD5325570.1 D-2-hydroxyacid dehydrogenase [Pontibacillus sp. HN14]WIF98678.1 D-2-hydroxyacid dehydrogenase [Pontibacillus chungwhensis]